MDDKQDKEPLDEMDFDTVILYFIAFCLFVYLLSGCSTGQQTQIAPNSMDSCRVLCKGSRVDFYKNDEVECYCRDGKDHK